MRKTSFAVEDNRLVHKKKNWEKWDAEYEKTECVCELI